MNKICVLKSYSLTYFRFMSTYGLGPNATHFEPLRASVRAGRLVITCESGPHASALRLKIYKVSAIRLGPSAH